MVRPFLFRVIVLPVIAWSAAAQLKVFTQSSFGQAATNFDERHLTTSNVNLEEFGKLSSYRLDAPVAAQPVFVSGATVNGVRHNVVNVLTINDTLYAFDTERIAKQPIQITRRVPEGRLGALDDKRVGGPAWWDSPVDGPLGYGWLANDVLKAYRLDAAGIATSVVMHGAVMSPRGSGASLTLSANGRSTGTGIVWASMPREDVSSEDAQGILRAFDAETLNEIWTSEQNSTRDRLGAVSKFMLPVVADGKVFVTTSQGSLVVYGPLPRDPAELNADRTRTTEANAAGVNTTVATAAIPDFSAAVTPASRTVRPGAWTSYTVTVTPLNGFTASVGLTVSGAPGSTTAVFSPSSVSGTGTATLKVSTSSFTPSGTWRLTIKGISGELVHTATATLVVGTPSAIGINFLGSATTTMAPGESAGVVAKTHWNNGVGARRSTPLALVDDTGTLRTATATWTANNGWMTPIADVAGNARLMKGYLDNTNTTRTTVTVDGLPSATYDVYVYADGDNKAYNRTAAYTISGPGIPATTIGITDPPNTNFSGSFIQGAGTSGNYVKHRITGTGFTITATPGTSTNTNVRAPVNAIQIVNTSVTPPVSLAAPLTVSGIGAGQGVELRDGKVYLYGDASKGIVREYTEGTSALTYTGRQVLLTSGGQDLVSHPTGLTTAPGLSTFLGNTVAEKGTIFAIDWARALTNGTLDGAIQATITDDLAVNGSRPEFVRVGTRWLVATADYGAVANEVRLYDPERLKTASRTSEPGVLVHRFRSSPYVQTLHWLDAEGLLVLVQNQGSGRGWRLTVIDLARSIAAGQQVVKQTIDLSPQDELEGFHVLPSGRGLFVTSSSGSNVYFANVRLF